MKHYGVYKSYGLYNQYTVLELEDGYNVFLKKKDGTDEFICHVDTLEMAEERMEENDREQKEKEDDEWYIIDDTL